MKLENSELLQLLPPHLAEDSQFAAAAQAATPFLRQISLSIPNLLIFARLSPHAGLNADFLAPLKRLADARGGLAPLDLETLESLAWQFHVDFREAAKRAALRPARKEHLCPYSASL